MKFAAFLFLCCFLFGCGQSPDFYVTESGTQNILAIKPVAVIKVNPTTGTTATLFQFDGTESYDRYGNPVAAWQWDFGDGKTAQGKYVSHRFISSNLYYTKLFVLDNLGVFDWTEVGIEVEPRIER